MCAASVIHDYARQRIPFEQWTRDSFSEFQEILRRIEELDKKLGQPDCVDPAKQEWMQQVEERLRRLENDKLTAREPDLLDLPRKESR